MHAQRTAEDLGGGGKERYNCHMKLSHNSTALGSVTVGADDALVNLTDRAICALLCVHGRKSDKVITTILQPPNFSSMALTLLL